MEYATRSSSAAGSPWKLDGRRAKLSVGEFSAEVNVDQPGLGVHGILSSGKPIEPIRWLLAFNEQVTNESIDRDQTRKIEDVYVRGSDLVAVYAESKDHPLRYVMYWRALGAEQLCGAAAGLDVVVSVQTSVLDATPRVWLSSDCDASDVWCASAANSSWNSVRSNDGRECDHAFLTGLAGTEWCVGEMIHTQDRIESDVRLDEPTTGEVTAKRTQTRHQVLGLRLEKGVLLRARLRVVLTRRDGAREVVTACREQFEQAELPLTT